MKIIQITPGSGDNFYCENCLRDRALVRALRAQGHDVLMVPLYLPLRAEAQETITDVPIFYGGINVYLQQKLGLFRKTPRWLDKLFDSRGLLAWAGRKVGMTSARDLGETTLSMLKGEHGRQVKELHRLMDWLVSEPEKPDVVILSNILLGGLAAPLRECLQVPVVCLLQDEEDFVDSLTEPYVSESWDLMRRCIANLDALVAVSRTYAERIGPRLEIPDDKLHVVYMGLALDQYAPAAKPPEPPVVGYLSRTCPVRGLDTLVDAFILLKQTPTLKSLALHISGGQSSADEGFLRDIKHRLTQAGVIDDVTFTPEFLGPERLAFLQSLTVMCVPEREEVAYGLYALEALATGVPVVQPAVGVFPELLALTGGGTLVETHSPEAFAAALKPWLVDPEGARNLGLQGRQGMEEHFDVEKTGGALINVLKGL
ncbi:glycosyltransferase [Planctomycetota bacterium]